MRIIANNFIEASVQLLNTEVPFADFKKEDGSYHTITTFCEANNRAVELNEDGTRFIFAYELSDLDNVYSDLKTLLRESFGLIGGGSDFTNVGDELFWILTYTELQNFREANPNWITKGNK